MASARVRKLSRDLHRQRVHARVRTRVEGTPERPRLCVYRSLGHIYAQVIDDRSGKTLVSASSVDGETNYAAPPAFAPALPAFFFSRSPVMRTPFCLYGSGGRSERMSAATWPTWPLSAPLTTMCVCFSTAT